MKVIWRQKKQEDIKLRRNCVIKKLQEEIFAKVISECKTLSKHVDFHKPIYDELMKCYGKQMFEYDHTTRTINKASKSSTDWEQVKSDIVLTLIHNVEAFSQLTVVGMGAMSGRDTATVATEQAAGFLEKLQTELRDELDFLLKEMETRVLHEMPLFDFSNVHCIGKSNLYSSLSLLGNVSV